MLRFKFNYQQNTLAYQTKTVEESTWYQISEDQQFPGKFGSSGFSLDSGWMTFTVQANKIKVFYKQISNSWADFGEAQTIAYFRKDLPKEASVIFSFNQADEVEKIGQNWVKKGESKM